MPGPHGALTSSQQGLLAGTAVPSAGSEGRQLLLPWLRRRGVVQDPLELQLQVPRLEQAGAFVEPHLEEAALVVHGHVPALRQVLQYVCEGPGAEAAPARQPLPSRGRRGPPPTGSVARWPLPRQASTCAPRPSHPSQGWTAGTESGPALVRPCLWLHANNSPQRHVTEEGTTALGNDKLSRCQKHRLWPRPDSHKTVALDRGSSTSPGARRSGRQLPVSPGGGPGSQHGISPVNRTCLTLLRHWLFLTVTRP